MKIGRVIFFDKITGEIILVTSEYDNAVIKKSIEEQILTFQELSERNRETFDAIELPHGAYAQDFREGRLLRIDPESQELIFEYPNPENPDEPIIPDKPLSVEIQELKHENTLLKAQNKANADRADFHEEVLTEIILKINP